MVDPKSSRELEEESKALKQQVLDKFLDLSMRLPTNTLDDLLDRLGGPDKVAEVRSFDFLGGGSRFHWTAFR